MGSKCVFGFCYIESSSEKEKAWIIFQFMALVTFVDLKLWHRNIKVSYFQLLCHKNKIGHDHFLSCPHIFIITLSFSATYCAQWRKHD
jgi:hypothetical protein